MNQAQQLYEKVSIVNKFGPSGKAITGRNAREVADYLNDHNIYITYYCLGAAYKSEQALSDEQQIAFKVKELRNFYQGSNAYLRLIWGFIDGLRLWLASLNDKSDVVIVMTDPPLLFFWFQLFRKFSKRKLFYWTMDIYPEAFVAGNYIRAGNVFYRFFSSVVYRKAPDLIIALGAQQLQFLQQKFRGRAEYVILPCGVMEGNGIAAHSVSNNHKISFGYGGNIGEAHDAAFLVSLINQLDPQKHEIILSLYGSKAAFVKENITNKDVVQFRSFLNYDDIAALDVNVATILPEWNHICVPSKAVTAICCGSPILLNATKETDAWNMFKDVCWLVEAGGNYKTGLTTAINTITKEQIFQKQTGAKQLAKKLLENKNDALKAILAAVEGSK